MPHEAIFTTNLSRLEAIGKDELAASLRTMHYATERFAGHAIDGDLTGMVAELQRLNETMSGLLAAIQAAGAAASVQTLSEA